MTADMSPPQKYIEHTINDKNLNEILLASREYRQLIGGWLLGSFLASVLSFMVPIFAMFALIGILYAFVRLTLWIIPAKLEAWDCEQVLRSSL